MFLEHLHSALYTLPHRSFTKALVFPISETRELRHREVEGPVQGHTAGEPQRRCESGLGKVTDWKLGLTCVSTAQERGFLGGDPCGPGSL